MKLFAKLGKKTPVDLMTITTADHYQALNRYRKSDRELAAKKMVEKYTNHEIILGIKSLSLLCFEIHGPLFIRQGDSHFLADVIRAYVDKYDGPHLAATFDKNDISSLTGFKFSQASVEVNTALWRMASDYSERQGNKDYSDFLPSNISNKIWQPIIAARQKVGVDLLQGLQALASDTHLLKDIFMGNVTVGILKSTTKQRSLSQMHRVKFFIPEEAPNFLDTSTRPNQDSLQCVEVIPQTTPVQLKAREIQSLFLKLKSELSDDFRLELTDFEKKVKSITHKLFVSRLKTVRTEALTLLSTINYDAAKATSDLGRALIKGIENFDSNGNKLEFQQVCIDSFTLLDEQLQVIPDFAKKTGIFQLLAESIVKLRIGILTVEQLIPSLPLLLERNLRELITIDIKIQLDTLYQSESKSEFKYQVIHQLLLLSTNALRLLNSGNYDAAKHLVDWVDVLVKTAQGVFGNAPSRGGEYEFKKVCEVSLRQFNNKEISEILLGLSETIDELIGSKTQDMDHSRSRYSHL